MATVPPVRRVLASWFGSGLVLGRLRGTDAGSGTIASIVAWLMAVALMPLGWPVQLAVALAVTAASIAVTNAYAEQNDPGWVVIDEAAGTFVATIGLSFLGAIVALVVFRVADIWKATPGVGRAERLRGGWGITLDDVVAGGYGLAAGWLVQALLG